MTIEYERSCRDTDQRYVCTHICSLLFIHAINPSLPEQNAISKGPCVVLDVPSGFIRSSGTCGRDRDQGSGHDLLSATRSQYCSGIHASERELTEQDPQPQLEQSPLHEQVLQLLFKAWSADVPPSCILPIKVFPALRGRACQHQSAKIARLGLVKRRVSWNIPWRHDGCDWLVA